MNYYYVKMRGPHNVEWIVNYFNRVIFDISRNEQNIYRNRSPYGLSESTLSIATKIPLKNFIPYTEYITPINVFFQQYPEVEY